MSPRFCCTTPNQSVGAMGEVPLVSQAESSPSARRTEALQSCFCCPGLPSMTTGRRESCPGCLSPWRGEVRAAHETRITAFMAVRFAVGAKGPQHQKPPPGPPNSPPSHCFTSSDCAQLCSMGGAFSLHLSQCPRTVSRSGWASRRAPVAGNPGKVRRIPYLAAPVVLRAPFAAANAK